MKTLLVNSKNTGGAAKACIRLLQGLNSNGIDSKILFKTIEGKAPLNSILHESVSNTIIETPKKNKVDILKAKSIRILKEFYLYKDKDKGNKVVNHELEFKNQRNPKLEMFSFPKSIERINQNESYSDFDIINLHWVANFLDFPSFFKENKKPVVWTLHDMNPFTGGEHYTEEYIGMDNDGFPVKRELTSKEIQIHNQVIKEKKVALESVDNLTIVSPSQWLADCAKKSELFSRFPIHVIANGIDSTIFKPLDRSYCRHILNIPIDKKVILFVSDVISNERKGFPYLIKAFEKLKLKETILLSIGSDPSFELENMISLGSINNDNFLSVIYSAADVLVIPSLMDNLPNTAIESLMCGTPVIGFPSGGINEIINHGKNGLLCKEISVDALAYSINSFLDGKIEFCQKTIHEDALNKYDKNIQSKNYVSLFNQILNN